MKTRHAAPVFQVADLAASLQHYTEILGFSLDFRFGDYAGVQLGEVCLHLCGHTIHQRPIGGGTVYIFCAEPVETYHAELVRRGANLIAPPRDYAYGMRDFIVADPDGNQLAFGCRSTEVPAPTDLLVAHDPAWAEEFAALSSVYHNALGELVLRIEHVGSTAVPGLIAKPILDIDLVIADRAALDAASAALSALGYMHCGDQGIAGREAFKRADDTVPLTQPPRRWLSHHLYVCAADNRELARHLKFRDALRRSPQLCQRYAAIKLDLARQSGGDRKHYALLKQSACREFVESTLLDI